MTEKNELHLKKILLFKHFSPTDKDYESYISYLNSFGNIKFIDRELNWIRRSDNNDNDNIQNQDKK